MRMMTASQRAEMIMHWVAALGPERHAVVKPCQWSKVKMAWFSAVANAVTRCWLNGCGDNLTEVRGQAFWFRGRLTCGNTIRVAAVVGVPVLGSVEETNGHAHLQIRCPF